MRAKAKIRIFAALMLAFCALGCTKQSNNTLAGYIEGEYVFIGSGVPGTLVALEVNRGQAVKRGEPLYQLDLKPEQDNIQEIIASIEQAKALAVFSKLQLERQQKLLQRKAVDESTVDQARADFESKTQQINIQKNKLLQAQWALDEKTKIAPLNSRVFDIYYRVGEKVKANQPVLSLLSPEYIKVLFYIPEEKLATLKIGKTIHFDCDSCSEKVAAKISYISPEAEYTPPVIYSKETRSKLMYLVRAKMPLDVAAKFHPGQPIDVILDE